MRPTLQAIDALGGSASNQEIHDWVVNYLGLPEDVSAVLKNDKGVTIVQDRLHWARWYLKIDGALDNSTRGIWTVLDRGRLMTDSDLKNVSVRVREYYKKRKGEQDSPMVEPSILPEVIDEVVDDSEADWMSRLLNVLYEIDPSAFERLCQRILRESGFIRVDVSGKSGDGGIDGIGVLRVNLVSFHVLFQAKRWRSSVGASVVRDFRGAMMGRAEKGLIITTGTFSADARKEATRDGATVIDLVDGEALCQLLKDLNLGVTTRQVEEVDVDTAFFAEL